MIITSPSAISVKPTQKVVDSPQRFAFGENWQRFLKRLTEKRIAEAEGSLCAMLQVEDLRGKSFLDIGCGSGLFSLAAMRLGAEKVFSFDFDPNSVACTRELKRRYFAEADRWTIRSGSILDPKFLSSLGQFDVIYSWGVLHHTGGMWQALQNVIPFVAARGKLFIAIYNDQGAASNIWRFIKKTYNRTPKGLRFVILWPIGALLLAAMTLVDLCRLNRPRILAAHSSPRGMSLWIDIVDWVGGYPFEVSTREKVVDFYLLRGFRLEKLVSCGRKLGCNQFVFTKI